MHWRLCPNELNLGGTSYFLRPFDPVKRHDMGSPFACPNLHQTPSGRNLKCMFWPFPLISMSSSFSHIPIWSSSNPSIFPCPRSHDEGGEKPFSPLWTIAFLLFSHLSLTPGKPQGIQCIFPHCLLPGAATRRKWAHEDAKKSRGCRPFARSGARQRAPDR